MRSVFVAALAFCCFGATIDDQDFNGRWDITVGGSRRRQRGWWLEVAGAGTENLKGKFLGAPVGLLDDIPKLSISEGELRFALEAKFRKDHGPEKGLYWARLEDGKLKGTFEIEGDPSTYLEWTGVRAPALAEKDDGSWKRGDPVVLFNGHDLTGWQAVPPGHLAGWVVKDGALTALAGALRSDFGKEIHQLRGGRRVQDRAAHQQRHRFARALRSANRRRCRSPAVESRDAAPF